MGRPMSPGSVRRSARSPSCACTRSRAAAAAGSAGSARCCCSAGCGSRNPACWRSHCCAAYDLLAAPDRGRRRVVAHALALRRVGCRRWRSTSRCASTRWAESSPASSSVPLTPSRDAAQRDGAAARSTRNRFFWPFDPNMYHDFDAVHSLAAPRFAAGAAVAAAVGRRARRAARAHRAGGVRSCSGPRLRWRRICSCAGRSSTSLPSVTCTCPRSVSSSPSATPGSDAAPAPRASGAPRRRGWRRWACWRCSSPSTCAARATGTTRSRSIARRCSQSPRAELIRTNLAVRYLELQRLRRRHRRARGAATDQPRVARELAQPRPALPRQGR